MPVSLVEDAGQNGHRTSEVDDRLTVGSRIGLLTSTAGKDARLDRHVQCLGFVRRTTHEAPSRIFEPQYGMLVADRVQLTADPRNVAKEEAGAIGAFGHVGGPLDLRVEGAAATNLGEGSIATDVDGVAVGAEAVAGPGAQLDFVDAAAVLEQLELIAALIAVLDERRHSVGDLDQVDEAPADRNLLEHLAGVERGQS